MLTEPYASPLFDFAGRHFTNQELGVALADEVILAGKRVPSDALPSGLTIHDIGIVSAADLVPRRLHGWPKPYDFAHCVRACRTPNGDLLAMCVVGGGHQYGSTEKRNEMVTYRSLDNGQTWQAPVRPWDVPYSQHAFNPLIPPGNRRIIAFGTDYHPDYLQLPHTGALGIRHSDDDGHTWSAVRRVSPINDPGMRGVYHMQGCVSKSGAWLLGTYTIENGGPDGRIDHQYVLRSEDQGETWKLLPGPRPAGWRWPPNQRMMEGRVLQGGEDRLLMFTRTCEGHLWRLHSDDDGRNWSDPAPTPLVHPDAPPMIFPDVVDGALIALIHNRPGAWFEGREELWATRSEDDGCTWSEPRFLLANAARSLNSERLATQVSYADLIIIDNCAHIFFDHGARQVLQLSIDVSDFQSLPTRKDLPV